MGKWLDTGSAKVFAGEFKGYLLIANLTPYFGEEHSYDYNWYFCSGISAADWLDLYVNAPRKLSKYEIPRDVGVPAELGVAIVLGGVGKTLIECLDIFKIKIIRGRVRITDEKMKSVYDRWYRHRFKKYWSTFEVEETPSCFKYRMDIKPEIYNAHNS